MTFILGLDLSTSCTGYTIIEQETKQTIVCEHIDLKKENNLFSKINKVLTSLKVMFETYSINQVFIEESLMLFSVGKSSAKTISTLIKFNGIISFLIENEFKIKPIHIAATSARKICGIKIEKGKKKAKEQVLEYMKENEKWFKIELTRTRKT